jgi:hypothetical protein
MENQIPITNDNLIKRGILNFDAQHCFLGCGFDETLSLFFFACDLTYNLWCGILQWLEIKSALHNIQVVHAQHFSGLHVHFLKYKKCFQSYVQLPTIWTIWRAPNDFYSKKKNYRCGFSIFFKLKYIFGVGSR